MIKSLLDSIIHNTPPLPGPQIYAIGDIHGCATELQQLLNKLTITEETILVFLGDYVDRGPQSRKVIDIILNLKKKCNVITLMGNHESMFLDFLERPETVGGASFIFNGGAITLSNYATENGSFEIPEEHLQFLKELKLFYETQTHFFVHAGVPLKKPIALMDPVTDREVFLWTRGPFLTTNESWGKLIVHGHSPKPKPELLPNRVNCDTGCVYGGSLTAFDVNRKKFISVPKSTSKEPSQNLQKDLNGKRIAVRFNGAIPVSAGRPGEGRLMYETINFNEFGLLIKELKPSENPHFKLNDQIEGIIGLDHKNAIEFEGTIVRSESRQGLVVFGVKITKSTNQEAKEE